MLKLWMRRNLLDLFSSLVLIAEMREPILSDSPSILTFLIEASISDVKLILP